MTKMVWRARLLKNFNIKIFFLASLVCWVLLLPAYSVVMDPDAGTLANSLLLRADALMVRVLWLPASPLVIICIALQDYLPNQELLASIFQIQYLLNCIFFGFVAERLVLLVQGVVTEEHKTAKERL